MKRTQTPGTTTTSESSDKDNDWREQQTSRAMTSNNSYGATTGDIDYGSMGSYHFYNNKLVIARDSLCRLTEISVTMELSNHQRFS